MKPDDRLKQRFRRCPVPQAVGYNIEGFSTWLLDMTVDLGDTEREEAKGDSHVKLHCRMVLMLLETLDVDVGLDGEAEIAHKLSTSWPLGFCVGLFKSGAVTSIFSRGIWNKSRSSALAACTSFKKLSLHADSILVASQLSDDGGYIRKLNESCPKTFTNYKCTK